MDTFNGKTPNVVSNKHSAWADDSGSTVGFARLQDEEGVMSPMELQRTVYAPTPIGAAISTSAGEGEKRAVPLGIMKESTIDQHSEIVE